MEKEPAPKPEIKLMAPQEIYDRLSRYVIGQHRAKTTIAVAAYNHLKRLLAPGNLIKKNNVLLVGPTGCGKTHIARTLATILETPFTVVNATEYTEAGYYGKDIEVMVAELLFAAKGDVEMAERGIVYVDEIDKIARAGQWARTGAGARDIGGEGVQQAFLKLLEANKVFVPINVTQHWNKHDFVQMDVSNILFICAGTFSDMKGHRHKGEIGFSGDVEAKGSLGKKVTTQDLEEYGFMAELIGRLPVIATLDELTEEELGRILVEPPDALIREYRQLFSFEGITLDLKPDGITALVRHARSRKIGARGLRGVVDEVFTYLSFHAPDLANSTVTIDADYVNEQLKDVSAS